MASDSTFTDLESETIFCFFDQMPLDEKFLHSSL